MQWLDELLEHVPSALVPNTPGLRRNAPLYCESAIVLRPRLVDVGLWVVGVVDGALDGLVVGSAVGA